MLDLLLPLDFLNESLQSLHGSKIRKTKRILMLEKYIRNMSVVFGLSPEELLDSTPVINYARTLDLSWYLKYLKKHPELIKY